MYMLPLFDHSSCKHEQQQLSTHFRILICIESVKQQNIQLYAQPDKVFILMQKFHQMSQKASTAAETLQPNQSLFCLLIFKCLPQFASLIRSLLVLLLKQEPWYSSYKLLAKQKWFVEFVCCELSFQQMIFACLQKILEFTKDIF